MPDRHICSINLLLGVILMRRTINLLGLVCLLFIQVLLVTEKLHADESWKNWYGIVWRGSSNDDIKYAKQMGYDYITINLNGGLNISAYKNNPDVAGLKFYFSYPHLYVFQGHSTTLDTTMNYTQPDIDWYNSRMVWKSYDPFPNNLASNWWDSGTTFRPMWDFQQQAVIDEVVENEIALFKSIEDQNLQFTFAGYIIDVVRLSGAFWRWENNSNQMTDLSYWTGSDSGLIHGTIMQEYATYTDGMAAYYKKLNTRMRQEFPGAKWILEPWKIYSPVVDTDEWVHEVSARADRDELTPDMLTQEGPGTEFVDKTENFNSGMNITRDEVGSSQRRSALEYDNRLFAATAGINGSWYNWYASFSDMGIIPNFQRITDVYPRLKLIRCIPNWDNLNNVPLNYRSWDGSVYQSTKSYISGDVIYSRHPKTGKLFAVFNTTNGVIKLNTGETVTLVQRTDDFFIETMDASADFDITGDEIRLKNSVSIAVDSSNGQIKGNGYIFTLSSDGRPQCTTGSATNVTSNSATLNGLVNANGLSTTAWFEYGMTSGSYGNKLPTQSISGSSDTSVSDIISGLSEGTTYYYRLVAQNSAGTTYGAEKSFTTLDKTAPNCSISINR